MYIIFSYLTPDFEKISMETVGEQFKEKDVFFCTLGTTRRAAGSAVSLMVFWLLVLIPSWTVILFFSSCFEELFNQDAMPFNFNPMASHKMWPLFCSLFTKDVSYIENNSWVVEIWNFSLSVQLFISLIRCAHSWDIGLNMRREMSYLQAAMYYLLTSFTFQKQNDSHSFMALNRVNDVGFWLAISNTCAKLSSFFLCGDMVLLAGENPY